MSDTAVGSATGGTYQLGVSRPPLQVADLPTPEEVWKVPRVGRKEAFKYAVGPSFIALGAAIGSGEWLLGPLSVGKRGFVGIGWIITVSILLQVIYNIECSRYVVATGEVPIVGFARVPPGRLFWVPFSLLLIFFAYIWGGWAKGAADGLFSLINGRVPDPVADKGAVELLAILLLAAILGITVGFRRITRGLEFVNGGIVAFVLLFLVILSVAVVPLDVWWQGLRGFVTPAMPPKGITATEVGSLAGFAALLSGFNWVFLNHYRDKSYGMGHRVGYLSGLRGHSKVLPSGFTFPDDPANASVWKRWKHLLYLDMWGVFLTGAVVGMLVPTSLMRHLALTSGRQPERATVTTFAADVLGNQYGRWLFYLTLLVGFLILFSTQLGIFEVLVRNATDAANISPRVQEVLGGDPRRFYFPFMVALLTTIGIVLHFFQPTELIQISANMSNLGAIIFPFVFIYLNRRLPKAARPSKWAYAGLMANVVFFGFFFLNFVVEKVSGDPLVTF
ncbi:MAG TPA: Nramp family divalent metal transporter [Acidimicrobiia bacterium]|nr:Nramp family divalent metal transporter [Acidimicrobiia bacterium]